MEKPEVPEIEGKDPYGRRVALTIAVLAVVLSIIATLNDNAKLEGLLAATRASSSWAYFQSKSIKENSYSLQRDLLAVLVGVDEGRRRATIEQYEKKVKVYGREKDEIKIQAEKLEKAVEHHIKMNDRLDLAVLQLQIGIVLGSIAILVRWRAFWFVAIALGLSGVGTAVFTILH